MSFGSSKPISQTEQKVLSLRVNQSAYGLAIGQVFGTARVSGNLVYYTDFQAIEHTETQGGGKGGAPAMSSTTYSYKSAFILGLCAGPIRKVGRVWADKIQSNVTEQGFEVFTGAVDQAPWSYLTAKHPAEAVSYSGLAYVAASSYDLGATTSAPNLSFEVSGMYSSDAQPDAEPADVITTIATDKLLGAGMSAAQLGDLTHYRDWCAAMGFRLSPELMSQAPARAAIDEILQATHAAPVWSENKLKIVPFGDRDVGSWRADATPIYDLTEDDFLDQDEPVKVKRKRQSDCYNGVTVEYISRENDYNTAVAEKRDLASIDKYGYRPKGAVTLRCIKTQAVAETVADTILSRELYIRNEYSFKVDWRYCALEPMDLVTLTHERLGLNKTPVRIVEIDDAGDEMTITAEEWPFGVAHPARIPSQPSSGYTPNLNSAAGNANPPVIFEAPPSLSDSGKPEIWIGASGGANWGGCEVWISLDDATYSRAGEITAAARHGILTAALPIGPYIDSTNNLDVDLTVSSGRLYPVTEAERDLFASLSYVDGELIAYQGAALTAVSKYQLTNMLRGSYGTEIKAHAAGTKFMRCDSALLHYVYDPALIGKTVYIKLRSFNKVKLGMQELSDCSAYAFHVQGVALDKVSGLTLERPFTGKVAAWKWDAYPGAASYTVELWNNATTLKRSVTGITATRFEISADQALADGLSRNIQIRVIAVAANGQSSTPATLFSANPQMPAVAVTAIGASEMFQWRVSVPSADDWPGGVLVWASSSMSYTPTPANAIYDGPNTSQVSNGLEKGNWYVWAAAYDVWGKDSLNITGPIAMNINEMAQGVQRVADVSTITAPPGSDSPLGDAYWAVYDLATGKMARWDKTTGHYVFAIQASDIAGTVSAAQIAANAITSTKIADGAISTPKLAAGAVQAGNIAAGAVTTGALSAGAVNAVSVQAQEAVFDKVAVSGLSALSGTIEDARIGTLVLDNPQAGFMSYIKTPTFYWGKPASGWMQGYDNVTGSYWNEFRADKAGVKQVQVRYGYGSAIGLASGGVLQMYVADASGNRKFEIDTVTNTFYWGGNLAANSITTESINGEAVTTVRSMDGSAPSITLNTNGGSVLLLADCTFQRHQNHEAQAGTVTNVYLRRDGVSIKTLLTFTADGNQDKPSAPIKIHMIDSPGTGSHVYDFYATVSMNPSSTPVNPVIGILTGINFKR